MTEVGMEKVKGQREFEKRKWRRLRGGSLRI
jgi:hypothetical protein